jgi:hypothetical protein
MAGDAALAVPLPEGILLCLIDVLGHGRDAAEVALAAIRYLKANPLPDSAKVLEGLHETLRGTRGAAVGIAFANMIDGSVAYSAVGNIVARRFGTAEQAYPSRDGIVGVRFRTPRVERIRLHPGDVFLLHSDGVVEGFALPCIAGGAMEAIARRVVLENGKTYDDAACLALRYSS